MMLSQKISRPFPTFPLQSFLKNIKNILCKWKIVNNRIMPSMHAVREITNLSNQHSFTQSEMLPTCQRHVVPTQDVAPILARWVRVADTRFKMSGPFVSATADTNFSRQNPSTYVETYRWYVCYIRTLKYPTTIFLLPEQTCRQSTTRHKIRHTKRSSTPHDVGDMFVCWADVSGRHGQMSSKVTFCELKNVDISDQALLLYIPLLALTDGRNYRGTNTLALRGLEELFLQLCCCVSFWFWRGIGFGFTYLCTQSTIQLWCCVSFWFWRKIVFCVT